MQVSTVSTFPISLAVAQPSRPHASGHEQQAEAHHVTVSPLHGIKTAPYGASGISSQQASATIVPQVYQSATTTVHTGFTRRPGAISSASSGSSIRPPLKPLIDSVQSQADNLLGVWNRGSTQILVCQGIHSDAVKKYSGATHQHMPASASTKPEYSAASGGFEPAPILVLLTQERHQHVMQQTVQGQRWQGSMTVTGIDAEEERKLARRRHRKRVARIVVDHWKAFAADRLKALHAVKHHRRQLQLSALLAIRQAAAAAGAAWKRAGVFAARQAFLQLHRCLLGWHSWAKRSSWLHRCTVVLQKGRMARHKRAVLQAWRQQCELGRDSRRMELKAWYFYSFITLTKALRAWGRGTAISATKREQRSRAAAHWRTLCLSRCVKAWLQAIAHWQAKKCKEDIASSYNRSHRLAQVLACWRSHISEATTACSRACQKLGEVAAQLSQSSLRECLMWWKEYCQDQQYWRQVQRLAVLLIARRRLKVCLRTWRSHASRQGYLRRCGEVMAITGRRWRLRVLLQGWQSVTLEASDSRAMQARQQVLLAATFRSLVVYWHHRVVKADLCEQVRQRLSRLRLAAAFKAWRQEQQRLRAKQQLSDLIGAWSSQQMKKKAVAGWQAVAAQKNRKRLLQDVAARHWQASARLRAMKAWTAFISWRHVKEDVVAWSRLRMLRSVVLAWLRHARLKAHRKVQHRVALQHRCMTTLSLGLQSLKAAVHMRHEKEQRYLDMQRYSEQRMMAAALNVWARQFLALAAEDRERRAQASRLWQQRLAARAFLAWRQGSDRLIAKRALQQAADRRLHLYRLRLYLHLWQAGLEAIRAATDAKRQRLQWLRRQLSMGKLSRTWDAWVQVHSSTVMDRFKESRAHTFWCTTLLRTHLHSWVSWSESRHHERLLAARAATLLRTHLLARALQAWQDRVRGWQEARAVVLAAAQHYRRALLLRSLLGGFRWYVQYRRAKVAALLQAKVEYTTRLQREGVQHWLAVGLWRKQQRIQSLAEKQARALTAEMVLVEPFARHWLRMTREGRRRRAEAPAAAQLTRWTGFQGSAAWSTVSQQQQQQQQRLIQSSSKYSASPLVRTSAQPWITAMGDGGTAAQQHSQTQEAAQSLQSRHGLMPVSQQAQIPNAAAEWRHQAPLTSAISHSSAAKGKDLSNGVSVQPSTIFSLQQSAPEMGNFMFAGPLVPRKQRPAPRRPDFLL